MPKWWWVQARPTIAIAIVIGSAGTSGGKEVAGPGHQYRFQIPAGYTTIVAPESRADYMFRLIEPTQFPVPRIWIGRGAMREGEDFDAFAERAWNLLKATKQLNGLNVLKSNLNVGREGRRLTEDILMGADQRHLIQSRQVFITRGHAVVLVVIVDIASDFPMHRNAFESLVESVKVDAEEETLHMDVPILPSPTEDHEAKWVDPETLEKDARPVVAESTGVIGDRTRWALLGLCVCVLLVAGVVLRMILKGEAAENR